MQRYKDNTITKNKRYDRFITGRLYAHLRHEELKQAMQQIKEKEGVESSDDNQTFNPPVIESGGSRLKYEAVEYDDTYKLPYGFGYDDYIKKKTDMLNKQKIWNNKVMDELVEKLGYMDYRDALACNKYILEMKRHGDYHQQARAQVLSLAFAKFSQ